MANSNKTVNILAGVDGIKYYNLIDGATNTMEFLCFFEEASNVVDINTRRPVPKVDDITVVDNLPAHHGEGE